MKISDVHVIRMAVMQRLQIVYGIKIKSSLKFRQDSSTGTPCHPNISTKVFGVPLENVYACAITEYGLVPRFLVDTLHQLLNYADTEGLFRKSSSVTRLKSLKAKVDQGEDCLTTALPCDVASLVKQFFRELPAPIFPVELHEALLQARQLPSEQAKASATQLMSCLLPERNVATLRFLSCFLNRLSKRATENKMTAYNLSLIFAPNLFPFDTNSISVEGHDKLEVAVMTTFIENAHHIGVIPDEVVEIIPSLLDACTLEEMDMDRKRKRKGRLSDSVQRTPSFSKRRCSQSSRDGYQSRKKPRERRSFCLGMLPRILFKPGEADLCPLVTENQRPSSSAKRNRCASVYQKVKRAVEGNMSSCLSSSKQEELYGTFPTDLPSAQNLPTDTPVGTTSGKIQKSDEAPRKQSSLSSILKTLCCLSDPKHSEKPEWCSSACTLTQDGGGVLLDSQNNNSSHVNPKVRDEEQACSTPPMPSCVTPAGSVFTMMTPVSSALSPVGTRVTLFKTPAPPPLKLGLNCKGRELDMAESKYEDVCQETAEVGVYKDFVLLEQSNDGLEEDDLQLETLRGAQVNATYQSVPYQDQEQLYLLQKSACTSQPVLGTPTAPKPHTGRVAAHVKIFSSLRSLTPKSIRSPINFQRTPVYQYVRRMNSLIEKGCIDRGGYRGHPLKHR